MRLALILNGHTPSSLDDLSTEDWFGLLWLWQQGLIGYKADVLARYKQYQLADAVLISLPFVKHRRKKTQSLEEWNPGANDLWGQAPQKSLTDQWNRTFKSLADKGKVTVNKRGDR